MPRTCKPGLKTNVQGVMVIIDDKGQGQAVSSRGKSFGEAGPAAPEPFRPKVSGTFSYQKLDCQKQRAPVLPASSRDEANIDTKIYKIDCRLCFTIIITTANFPKLFQSLCRFSRVLVHHVIHHRWARDVTVSKSWRLGPPEAKAKGRIQAGTASHWRDSKHPSN